MVAVNAFLVSVEMYLLYFTLKFDCYACFKTWIWRKFEDQWCCRQTNVWPMPLKEGAEGVATALAATLGPFIYWMLLPEPIMKCFHNGLVWSKEIKPSIYGQSMVTFTGTTNTGWAMERYPSSNTSAILFEDYLSATPFMSSIHDRWSSTDRVFSGQKPEGAPFTLQLIAYYSPYILSTSSLWWRGVWAPKTFGLSLWMPFMCNNSYLGSPFTFSKLEPLLVF